MAAITGHIPSLRRQIKNVACNYSDAQVKVREATSNDPWGASSSLMSEIADLTFNALAFTEIMQIIWKRLNDSGKNWRHVYKSLVLLDYLIKVGSDKVAHQCRENIFAIQTLKDFQHIEDNKDMGMNVREKAKQLVAILKDDERLKVERTKAQTARKRFTQNGSGNTNAEGSNRRLETCRSDNDLPSYESSVDCEKLSALTLNNLGVGSGSKTNGTTSLTAANKKATSSRSASNLHSLGTNNNNQHHHHHTSPRADVVLDLASMEASELEECRPRSAGEEEMQLQIALALSKEDADRDQDVVKSDDVRLQMALQESQHQPTKPTHNRTGQAPAGQSTSAAKVPSSALDDLLTLQTGSSAINNDDDPWGGGSSVPYLAGGPDDPWAPKASSIEPTPSSFDDPFVARSQPAAASNDPWAAPASNGFTSSNGGTTAAIGDPWGADILAPSVVSGDLADKNGGGVDLLSTSAIAAPLATRQLKTPENFLGENSNLVNLDNLLSAPAPKTTAFSGLSGKSNSSSTSNPFSSAGVSQLQQQQASGGVAPPPNPFAAQQKRATPTLNEMRSGGTVPNGPNGWPSSTAPATNPFL